MNSSFSIAHNTEGNLSKLKKLESRKGIIYNNFLVLIYRCCCLTAKKKTIRGDYGKIVFNQGTVTTIVSPSFFSLLHSVVKCITCYGFHNFQGKFSYSWWTQRDSFTKKFHTNLREHALRARRFHPVIGRRSIWGQMYYSFLFQVSRWKTKSFNLT